jgi:hypothetical protein
MTRQGKEAAEPPRAVPFEGGGSTVLPPVPRSASSARTAAYPPSRSPLDGLSGAAAAIPSLHAGLERTANGSQSTAHKREPVVNGTPLAYLESIGFQTVCEAIVVSSPSTSTTQ